MNCNFRRNKNVDLKMKITTTGPSASLHYINYCFIFVHVLESKGLRESSFDKLTVGVHDQLGCITC